ncbi:MAG: TIGR02147 family protein [Chitinivibrionales bacterium]
MADTLSLHDYLDYREYLKEYIAFRRALGEKLTNRSFAAAVGIASSSWLTTVINGQKGISEHTVDNISTFIQHNEWERQYFLTLVRFNQSKTVEARNRYFASLKQHLIKKGYHAVGVLEPQQYEYYSKWYFSAVRSVLGMVRLKDDYKTIARLVSPSITESKAKKSINVLQKLDLIRKDERGYYVLTNKAISTGQKIRSLAVANFQRETMRLAAEAIDRYPASQRDISTLSVGISRESYEQITRIIAECRKRIVDLANNDTSADQVYQVNFQAFPLSKKLSRKKPENYEVTDDRQT